MAECPFIPPYPIPPKRKPGLLRRFGIGWNSWIHTLYEKSYTMKMGATRLPRLTMFLINELPLAHLLMDDEAREFPKHWLLNAMVDPLIGNNVFSANGEDWAEQRQMVNPAFAHTNLARAFPVMAEAVADLVALIRAENLSRPLDIDPLMTHVTADVIFRTLFGTSLSREGSARVYEAFNLYQRHAQRAAMLRLYGLPRLGYGWRAARAAAAVRGAFEPIIRARHEARQRGERPEKPDILEALLDARHPKTGAPFGWRQLVDQVAIIFLAGHETSASALSWTLYLLAESPALQERLHAEIMAETGGGPVGFEALKRLEGVRNLFREALRLYPPVSFYPRTPTRPMVMRDKAVEPGDLVAVSPWLIQRNPENWACPHAFDPDRFTTPEGAEALKHAWMPFGRGPRLCIGAGFAQQEAALILAELIRAFRLEWPGGKKPRLTSRLTLRPEGGIPLRIHPR